MVAAVIMSPGYQCNRAMSIAAETGAAETGSDPALVEAEISATGRIDCLRQHVGIVFTCNANDVLRDWVSDQLS